MLVRRGGAAPDPAPLRRAPEGHRPSGLPFSAAAGIFSRFYLIFDFYDCYGFGRKYEQIVKNGIFAVAA